MPARNGRKMDVRWLTAALSAAFLIGIAALMLTLLDGTGRAAGGNMQLDARVPSGGAQTLQSAESAPAEGRAVVVGAAPEIGPEAACMRCHGVEGVADGSGAFPRLDGQPEWYLYKQLKDYAAGTRPNDIMTPIAENMTDEQMRAVARWYAAQESEARRAWHAFPPLTLQEGGAIAAIGLADDGVTACVACHGSRGEGMPPAVPYLAGQYAAYTALQLQLWKEGIRRNDPADVMRMIALQMSEEQIAAVAQYYEAIPAAPDAAPADDLP